MKLTVTTVYENIDEQMFKNWCRQIVGETHSREVIRELKTCGRAVIHDKDPNPKSKATKTTTFILQKPIKVSPHGTIDKIKEYRLKHNCSLAEAVHAVQNNKDK